MVVGATLAPITVLASIDFLYVPASDVDAAARWYVDVLGARVEWKVRGMGTTVACVRLADAGPALLLSGHLDAGPPIVVSRVDDYGSTVAALRAAGAADLHELEIPHGPCASFRLPDGQRGAIYQLVRPEAATVFDGRFDP
jgi:catechol 2,3-dioxygenase-like lactoylglutathione lyase family enzyme